MSAGRLLLVLAATIAISSTYACAEAPTEGGAEIGIAASGEALKGCNKKDKAVVVSCENAKLWRCDTPDKCKSAILELRKGEQATVIKDCASDTGFFKVRLTGDGKEGFAKGACLKLQSGGGGDGDEGEVDAGTTEEEEPAEPEPEEPPPAEEDAGGSADEDAGPEPRNEDAGAPAAEPAAPAEQSTLSEEKPEAEATDDCADLRSGELTEDASDPPPPAASSCAAAAGRPGGSPWLLAMVALPLLRRRRRA